MPEVLPIAALDLTICRMVRARDMADLAARYAAADAEKPGCLPPVDVFRGGGVLLLADGGNRVAALTANGRQEVSALVRNYPTEAEAEAAACAHAAGANESHGARRSRVETERAVELAITTQPAWLSDKDIARLCRTSAHTASKVRCRLSDAGDLSGERAVGRHRYPATGRPHGFPAPVAATPRPRAVPGSRIDSCRQTIPERLWAVFEATEYGEWFSRTNRQLTALADRISDRLKEPELAAVVKATSDAGQVGLAELLGEVRRRLREGEPFAVCPPCRGKGCPTCHGRGWLSEPEYKKLPHSARAA